MAEMTFDLHNPPKLCPIAFFALDGVQSLDVTGPMEAFAVANRFGSGYELSLCSVTATPIQTHAGISLGPVASLDTLSAVDTLVVCGGSEDAMMAAWEDGTTIDMLKAKAASARRVVSICTGAFVLAAAGMLDGRRAATHWNAAARFRELFPNVALDGDAIYVADPPFYTSAGVTAGIDLSLALIETDHGSDMARAVARELVLFLRRPGGQAQFGAGLNLPAKGPEPILQLAARILEDPSGQLHDEGRRVPELAALANMSERTFLRAFTAATGTTPAKFVEEARLTRAKSLLEETTQGLEQVAFEAGYGSVDALLRSFHSRLGLTPGAYRARFAVAGYASTSPEAAS